MASPAGASDSTQPNERHRPFGVVIADNDDQVRGALSELIADHPRLNLLGEAMDGLAAAELCARHLAQIAVIDVRMPHGGAEAAAAIKAACPSTVIAAYTTLADRRTRNRLLDAGASVVLLKGGGVDIGDALAALGCNLSADAP